MKMAKPELISARRLYLHGARDPFSMVTRLFMPWVCRDRFGMLNEFSPYRLWNGVDDEARSLLDWKQADKVNIKDAVDKKAKAIIEANEHVTVSWSGGVDSTSVVVSLLKNGLDPKKLHIICAESSCEEYPWMADHLQKIGVDMRVTNAVATAYLDVEDGAIVTGWCADQLFGSNIHLHNLDLYSADYMEAVKWFLRFRGIGYTEQDLTKIHEVWSAYAKVLGVNVEQFCEFAWLVNFGVKWTYVSRESHMAVSKESVRSRIIPFFEDVDFQLWSLQNTPALREVNVNRQNRYYKRPLKEYIYSYTNEDDYLKHKGKKNSWVLVVDRDDFVGVHDTDGWHAYRLKGNPVDPDLGALRTAVARKYKRGAYAHESV